MRRGIVVAAMAVFVLMSSMTALALPTFTVGAYEFESYISSMTYTGTWTTTASGAFTFRQTTAVSASVSFQVSGSYLVVYRSLRSSGTNTADVCVNATCQSVNSTSTAFADLTVYPIAFALSGAPTMDTITITRTAGGVYLDSFMVLGQAGSTFPTPVPTSTVVPTSTPQPTWTPASTTTPQPTWTLAPSTTPAPTATPFTGGGTGGVVWAIDPGKTYSEVNGQIVSTEYSASASDVHLANLLTLLVISVWGFFFFAVFVLVRFRK